MRIKLTATFILAFSTLALIGPANAGNITNADRWAKITTGLAEDRAKRDMSSKEKSTARTVERQAGKVSTALEKHQKAVAEAAKKGTIEPSILDSIKITGDIDYKSGKVVLPVGVEGFGMKAGCTGSAGIDKATKKSCGLK